MFSLSGESTVTSPDFIGSQDIDLRDNSVLIASNSFQIDDTVTVSCNNATLKVKIFLGIDLTEDSTKALAMQTALTEAGASVNKTGPLVSISGTYSFNKENLIATYNSELYILEYNGTLSHVHF